MGKPRDVAEKAQLSAPVLSERSHACTVHLGMLGLHYT